MELKRMVTVEFTVREWIKVTNALHSLAMDDTNILIIVESAGEEEQPALLITSDPDDCEALIQHIFRAIARKDG